MREADTAASEGNDFIGRWDAKSGPFALGWQARCRKAPSAPPRPQLLLQLRPLSAYHTLTQQPDPAEPSKRHPQSRRAPRRAP